MQMNHSEHRSSCGFQSPAKPSDEGRRLSKLHALGLLDTGSEAVFDAFTELAAAVTGMPVALISLVDAERQWFKSAVGLAQGAETPRSESFCGHAILTDQIFEIENALKDYRFASNPSVTGGARFRHYAGVPLVMPTGERLGTVCVLSDKPGRLDERCRLTLKKIANLIVQVLVLREKDLVSQARLREQRQMLELALQASGQGMWEYWPANDRIILSEAWAAAFGFEGRRELTPADLAHLVAPEAILPLRTAVADLVAARSSKFSLEYQQKDARGAMVWVRNDAQVGEIDQDGLAVRVVGIVRDVSAEKELEQHLTQAAMLAEKASRAKGNFLATMSHEIRTPINGVIGLSRMLSQCQLPQQESRYVSLIASCSKTLLGLVDNVLDFSKIEAGLMTLERAETNLRSLLRETCDVFAARAEDKGLVFRFHEESELPNSVLTDGMRLRQVLLNLLGNALKFTSQGYIAMHARCEGLAGDELLVLEVKDSGVGIPPEKLSTIFERYVQAESATYRHYRGTGLGLAISREIAHLMGGTISVDSEVGRGSVFTLTLPVERTPEAIRDRPGAAVSARRVHSEARILLAEDDEINQMVAEAVLSSLGYTNVKIVADGRQVLTACESNLFDLILMDCNMPNMDGVEATRALRENGFRSPIIALTASATLQDRQDCLSAGMTDYITKPIEPANLAHALNVWLPTSEEIYS